MDHQDRGERGCGDGQGLGFLVGQALSRIEERLIRIERKIGLLLPMSGDLTPEEKTAFEERLKRLEGLGTPPPTEKT